MGKYIVYGIQDIREPGRIRYVGKTTGDPKVRMSNHWTYSRRPGSLSRIHGWLRSRSSVPEVVEMIPLAYSDSDDELSQLEIDTIRDYRARGMADLNLTDGGEGLRGYSRSPESRKAISEKYRASGGPVAKLTWDQVREIREHRMKVYEESADTAKRYGVLGSAISRILLNVLWRDDEFDPGLVVPRPPGSHRSAAFNMDTIREIRTLRQSSWVSSKSIAENYGVSESAIQHILDNRSYRDPNYDPATLIRRGQK